MITIKAINKKHQAKVNKAIKKIYQYEAFDKLRNNAESEGNMKLYRAFDKKCENAFNSYLETLQEMPKREAINLEKQLDKRYE